MSSPSTSAPPSALRWGTSWRQRLRLAPLFVAMAAADGLARFVRPRAVQALPAWRAGLSIIIPERDAPALLRAALHALRAALAQLPEPAQVIVVANGAPATVYGALQREFPEVEFVFSDAPLGFGGAVERGLELARHDWTYLLNNDMTVEPDALAALLPLRAADVFAVSSQIFQRNAAGRREETGFTDWYVDETGVQLFHAPVGEDTQVRPHLCASGGAALFRTAPLARYVREARCYDPFYWEDVDWSVRAWRDGLRVLFCPESRAAHRHRATTARFYAPAELERIVQRNRLLFHARHRITDSGIGWLMNEICALPYASQLECSRPAVALGVLRRRLHARRSPQAQVPPTLPGAGGQPLALQPASYSYRLRAAVPQRPARARMLVVAPFAVFPPRHGGARRVVEVLRALAAEYDVVLVMDEAQQFDARSLAHIDGLYAVHLVERGRDPGSAGPDTLDARMRTHCHPALVAAVEAARAKYRPVLVQVEHAELAALVACRGAGERWILDLHDACTARDFTDASAAARFEREVLAAYDAVVVCSEEDRALVRHPRAVCAGNGSAIPLGNYQPSTGAQLLFIGPFRYGPNLDGVLAFLRLAFPAIRAAHPQASLRVLGGDGAREVAARHPAFAQPGVEVLAHRDDVAALLGDCALTINPLTGIRGSAVKLVEALTAGRACVSTADAARGFAGAGFDGLVTVPDVGAMAAPIIDLLASAQHRHRIEAPKEERLAPHQWAHCLRPLTALCRELLASPEADLPPAEVAGNYDRIARFYDVDMARNMLFDDVAFYADLCRRHGGRVLELGCGSGRILLPLRAQGIDAIGIDASRAMLDALRRKAAAMGIAAPVAQMDLRALALRPGFDVVLCPYSLITYLVEDADVAQLFAGVTALLAPGGIFVVDAFVPGALPAAADFALDYRRPNGDGVLARYKRVTARSPTVNRIERRYEVEDAGGAVRERVEIGEDIRPYAPDALRDRLLAAGFDVDAPVWDYAAACAADGARFVTFVARPVRAAARRPREATAHGAT